MAKLSRVVFAAAFAVGVSLVSFGGILVYDGFPTGSGAYSKTDKSKLSDQGAGNFTTSSIFGFDPKNWQNSTGVIYSFTSGLSLPDGFDALPSVVYVGAGSAGASADGSQDERGQYKQLSADVLAAMKSAKELHFRFLIHADQNALNALTANSKAGNVPDQSAYAAGICLSTSMSHGSVRNSNRSTVRTLGFAIRRVGVDGNGAVVANLSLLLLGSEDATLAGQASGNVRIYDLITSIDPTKTYICYAKVVVGGEPSDPEQISVMAQPVDEYDPAAAFADIGENGVVTANLIDNTGTGAPNYINFAAGSYKTNGGYFKVDEFALATSADDIMNLGIAGAPALQNVALTGSNGSFSLSATVTKAAATNAGALVYDSSEVSRFSAGAVEEDDTFAKLFTTELLTTNKTYVVAAYAENDVAATTNAVDTIYTGVLMLEEVKDADEYQCKPGEVTVSRVSADPYPLKINYKFASAKEGAAAGKTWVAPQPVVIPAGESSTTIYLQPLVDMDIGEDIQVSVSLEAGNYLSGTNPVVLTLKNLAIPEGYNAWVAPVAGKASVASNWSEGRVPNSTDKVLFDGDISNADCEWDGGVNGLTDTVAAWSQSVGYTGKVTVDTLFPEVANATFTCLTVTGDMTIDGGALIHPAHTDESKEKKENYWRLRLNVGGKLTVGTGGVISAYGKGSYGTVSHSGSAYGGSYDGANAWGSLTEPYEVGSSPNADGACNTPAGGAIWIEAAGSTTINGTISANGVTGWGKWNDYAGSGGALYLKTASLAGTGTISADCSNDSKRGSNSQTGGGGRVSILLTSDELTDFPSENITAYGGIASYAHFGGAGTVLVRSPQKPNGILYFRDRPTNKYNMYGYRPKATSLTMIPSGQTWTLDGIVFGPNAILRVPTGTTLSLVNGLGSVSSTGTERENGLLIDGGSLVLPSGDQTISGPWIFQTTNGVINGNLTVTDNGSVGTHFLVVETKAQLRRCNLTVTGDMTVNKGAYVYARRGGYSKADASLPGGASRSVHGGQNGYTTGIAAYGSIVSPNEGGAFGNDIGRANYGGGAVKLTVGGILTLNGEMLATPVCSDSRPGAGGSIDVTAARLVGGGSISANGTMRDYFVESTSERGASGGGRVAVKLTDPTAVISDEWRARVNAMGTTPKASKMTASDASSAGTVFLRDATGERLIVRNDNNAANNVAFTSIPSLTSGGESDELKAARLNIEGRSIVKLADDLKIVGLTMVADTKIDLNGNTLTVSSAKLGDVPLAAGTYAAGATALGDFVTDSVGGGSLIVKTAAKCGLTILLR